LKIQYPPTKKRQSNNNGCFGFNETRHFIKDCSNNPTNKKKGRRKKGQALTTKPWDDTSSKEET
jgi:hypothetical protein